VDRFRHVFVTQGPHTQASAEHTHV